MARLLIESEVAEVAQRAGLHKLVTGFDGERERLSKGRLRLLFLSEILIDSPDVVGGQGDAGEMAGLVEGLAGQEVQPQLLGRIAEVAVNDR